MGREENCMQNTCEAEEKVKSYIGTKIIRAVEMTDNEFNSEKEFYERSKEFCESYETEMRRNPRGFVSIRGESRGSQPGFKIFYPDGYISWSPKAVFEQAYREVTQSEKSLM